MLPVDMLARSLGFLSPHATLRVLHASCAFRDAGRRALTMRSALDLSDSLHLDETGAVALCGSLCGGALTTLDLSRCTKGVGDAALLAISRAMPQLRVLRLARCKRLADAGVAAVAAGCAELTELDLELCCGLTDNALRALASGRGFAQLKQLGMGGCGITDAGIEALAPGAAALTALDLGGCNRLTDRAARALAQLPRLSLLSLNDVHKLTDAGLAALANATTLRQLEIIACVRVTDSGVRALLSGGKGLHRLAVANCLKVTARAWRGVETDCVIEAA